MCRDFSCLITQSRQVVWKRGVSSHDHLEKLFEADIPELKRRKGFVKTEITPDRGYLYPEKDWTFKIDEDDTPDWFTDEHKLEAMRAFRKWKKETYALIKIKEARSPINPLQKIYKPTQRDIELLKDWASVWNSVGASVWDSVWDSVGASVGASVGDSVGASVRASVGASVWDSVGDSVWDSVWDSVGAYIGSLFNIWDGDYKFQPAVDLWKRGLVASFDGKTWRLHSGKNAKIVYEWTKGE